MIRPYRESDLSELLDVWYRATKVAHTFLTDEFLEGERTAIADQYLPLAETWVYSFGGKVIGFVALIGDEIGGLFVDPAHHGHGFGRALVDYALDLRGRLEVDVFKENVVGRRFYDRYGFTIVSERVHDQTGHDLLRMRLEGLRSED